MLRDAPGTRCWLSFLLGVAYGVGGTAFNISIRYIGFSLTYAIAVGLSSILGTLVPPLVRGQTLEILSRTVRAGSWRGVVAGALGIAICGAAGRLKEARLATKAGDAGGFLTDQRPAALAAGRRAVGGVRLCAGRGGADCGRGRAARRGHLERQRRLYFLQHRRVSDCICLLRSG